MGNNVSKVLSDQYLKLCALKVDETKQQQLLKQLLANLQSAEQQLVSELTPDPERLPLYQQDVLISCSDGENSSLIDEPAMIGEFPRIKLTADIVDYSFKQISGNQRIPELLKLIILSLKPTLFRLALEDYRTLVSQSNPILQTMDILISYVPLWKDEKKANYPTFKKLCSLLDFVDTTSAQLSDKLIQTVQPIAQIRENQQKRSLIFEKRLVEREASAAITKSSQLFVDEIASQINQRYQLEPLLTDFLEQHWSRLLTLEFVRRDQAAFVNSVKLFIRLINSLAEIHSKEAFNHLVDELPELKKGLLDGLTKLAVSELEANEFLTELEARHLTIIQQNSQLSTEQQSTEISENDQASQSSDEQSKPNIDEEDLIRLKPTDFYSMNNDEMPVVEQEISAASTDVESDSDLSDVSDELSSKDFFDILEHQLKFGLPPTDNQITDEELFVKMHKELSEVVFQAPAAYDSEEIKSYISLNDWYSIKDDKELHKLIYIDENTKRHIFANQMAQKSFTFSVDDINKLYLEKQIKKFVAPNIVAPALKKSLQAYREFLTERKTRNQQETAEVINILQQETETHSTPSLNSQDSKKVDQPTHLSDSAKIADITVGTWINYELNKRLIKCKLAARIVSKDVYIFVDRKGLKILEQSTQELEGKLKSGKIEIVESENSTRLESVIAKTRNLKS